MLPMLKGKAGLYAMTAHPNALPVLVHTQTWLSGGKFVTHHEEYRQY